MFDWPMSSPQMMQMFGFLPACAALAATSWLWASKRVRAGSLLTPPWQHHGHSPPMDFGPPALPAGRRMRGAAPRLPAVERGAVLVPSPGGDARPEVAGHAVQVGPVARERTDRGGGAQATAPRGVVR